jgi:phosphate acetyltransferase
MGRYHKSPVLSSLISRLKDVGATRANKIRICLPEFSSDERVRTAAAELEAEGDFEIITSIDCLDKANQELASKNIDGVVSGAVYSSGDVIRSGIRNVGMRDGVKALSSFFIMELPDEQAFIYSDCAVQLDPTAAQLAEIAILSAENCKLLLDKDPVVAMLSFSTLGSAKKGGKLDTVREAIEIIQNSGHGGILKANGELQVDAALIPDIFQKKSSGAPECVVPANAGVGANTLVFPDLNAGNIGYKLTERMANARAVGPILQGLQGNSNDLSRGCSVQDIKDVAYVTAFMGMSDAE